MPKPNKETANKSKQSVTPKKEKLPIFYMGFNLFGGTAEEFHFGGITFRGRDELYGGGGVETGLGMLLRWYIYKWGSFQTGVNLIYRYVDGFDFYSSSVDGYALYNNISLEIPLNLRIMQVFFCKIMYV